MAVHMCVQANKCCFRFGRSLAASMSQEHQEQQSPSLCCCLRTVIRTCRKIKGKWYHKVRTDLLHMCAHVFIPAAAVVLKRHRYQTCFDATGLGCQICGNFRPDFISPATTRWILCHEIKLHWRLTASCWHMLFHFSHFSNALEPSISRGLVLPSPLIITPNNMGHYWTTFYDPTLNIIKPVTWDFRGGIT